MLKLAELMGGIGKNIVEYGQGFVKFVGHDLPEELSDIFVAKNKPFEIEIKEESNFLKDYGQEDYEPNIMVGVPSMDVRLARQERISNAIFKYLIPAIAVGSAGVAISSIAINHLINNVPS